jgi:hypothetical protein
VGVVTLCNVRTLWTTKSVTYVDYMLWRSANTSVCQIPEHTSVYTVCALLCVYFHYILKLALLDPNKSTHMTATVYMEFLLSPCLFVWEVMCVLSMLIWQFYKKAGWTCKFFCNMMLRECIVFSYVFSRIQEKGI